MARQTTKPIPASFQKLDTNVTAADEYVNVRDLQVARKNHNILIARGLRRTLYTRSFFEGSKNTLWAVREGAIGDERLGGRKPIIETGLLIDYGVQSISVRLEGDVVGTGLDLQFRAVVDRPFGLRQSDASGTVVFTEGITTDDTITVPVPHVIESRRGGVPFYRFALFMEPEIGSNLANNIAISAVGSAGESVTVANASLPAGNQEGRVLHFGNTIPPRVCSKHSVSGANATLFVSKPFGPIPVAGTDQLDVDDVATFEPHCLSIYEDHLTTFDANRAGV